MARSSHRHLISFESPAPRESRQNSRPGLSETPALKHAIDSMGRVAGFRGAGAGPGIDAKIAPPGVAAAEQSIASQFTAAIPGSECDIEGLGFKGAGRFAIAILVDGCLVAIERIARGDGLADAVEADAADIRYSAGDPPGGDQLCVLPPFPG